jgi:hypothetical protein
MCWLGGYNTTQLYQMFLNDNNRKKMKKERERYTDKPVLNRRSNVKEEG